MNEQITVKTTITAPIEKVWACWTEPKHITEWTFASDDWCSPQAENDLSVGGSFLTRMQAKDGSMGFDFNGVYTEVVENEKISYTLEGGRKVDVAFVQKHGLTTVTESFDPETENPLEMQRAGWQAILDNFKKYVEWRI
jgi:uncharacterized protein YndB with AHSA1/START domain